MYNLDDLKHWLIVELSVERCVRLFKQLNGSVYAPHTALTNVHIFTNRVHETILPVALASGDQRILYWAHSAIAIWEAVRSSRVDGETVSVAQSLLSEYATMVLDDIVE